MLAVLDIVKNVFSCDLSELRLSLPTENELSSLNYSLGDIAVMSGKERCDLLRLSNIDERLFPLFIRSMQHLTSSYSAGSIKDMYRLHPHVSSRVWGSSSYCPLLGYPFVVSLPFHDSNPNLQKNDVFTTLPDSVSSSNEGKVNGLVNQGATCYLNSLLQSLFHLSAFRSIIYNIPTKDESNVAFEAFAAQEDSNRTISIPYALQRLFSRLQTGTGAADTTELTASFGWSASDGFVQHDVHELMHVLLNNLEAKLNNRIYTNSDEPGTNAIKELFQGVLENYVLVKEENYYGSTEEPFYDLQVVVKNNKDIYTSLDAFFQVEVLDGKNRYCLDRDGQQTYHRAEKGVRLKVVPPILLLHLTRFDYNMELGESKVFTKWAYYNSLNLSRYMPDQPYEETQYTLYSVLVHFGSNTGNGHYYCFLRSNGVWYRFNDEYVTPATLNEVFGSNFGGYTLNYWGSNVPHMNNAYLLVYIRSSLLSVLLRPINEDDVPVHVVEQLKYENEERLRLVKEAKEDHLFGRIKFVSPKEVVDNDSSLYYGIAPTSLKVSSQRIGKFHLDADLLSSCNCFIQDRKLCTEKEFGSVMFWFATATTFSRYSQLPVDSNEDLLLETPHPSIYGNGESLVRLSTRVVEGMKVRDVVDGKGSCTLLLTTNLTVPFIDMTTCDEEQENQQTEYHIFHHQLYDPIHLRVIPLGSSIIRRYPSSSTVSTLQHMEKFICERIESINLDEDEKHLLNHDYKYDMIKCQKEGSKSYFPSQGVEDNVTSYKTNVPQTGIRQSPDKSCSSMLFNVSRAALSVSESQADDLIVGSSLSLGHELVSCQGEQPIDKSSHYHSTPFFSPVVTSLSVHVEENKKLYTPLYQWGRLWEDSDPHTPFGSISSMNFTADEIAKSSSAANPSPLMLNTKQNEARRLFLFSGDILVWQMPVEPDNPNVFYKDITEFQKFLKTPVTVTIKLNRLPECQTLTKVTLSMSMKYSQLQRYVARLIGEKDYDRIRFCRHNQETNQPFVMRGSRSTHPTLRDLLTSSAHARALSSILYYERCKYPVTQVENAHSLQFQLYSESVRPISSHWILLPFDATITYNLLFQTIVEEIRRDFTRLLENGDITRWNHWRKQMQRTESRSDGEIRPLSFLEPLLEESNLITKPSSESEVHSLSPSSASFNEKFVLNTVQSEGNSHTAENNLLESSEGAPLSLGTCRDNADGDCKVPTSTALDRAPPLVPILDFILHRCRPEDAWQYFRLVDCWKGKIYNVFNADHPPILDSQKTFLESAMYRIEYLPLPFPSEREGNSLRCPSVSSSSSADRAANSSRRNSLTSPYAPLHESPLNGKLLSCSSSTNPNQVLLNIYHFCQIRGKRELWETHGDPFSMYVGKDELPSELLSRIADKLEITLLILQDWKMSFVKERRMVEVEPSLPIFAQWASFCSSCSAANEGGAVVPVDVCELNSQKPQKMPFLGLEHAKRIKIPSKQEVVVIRN